MIESALRTHLIEQESLRGYLATWNGELAVFNQEAPPDTDPKWSGQYGRIIFMVDATEDPERKLGATLSVDVMCEKGVQDPNVMEPIVRDLIDGYFFTQDSYTMMAKWQKSNYFVEANEKIFGVTIVFRLLAFPCTETVDPDPVLLLNEWSEGELSEALGAPVKVIGHNDGITGAWKPTKDAPAIYWRISQTVKCGWIPDTYAVIWQDATLQGHIFASDVQTELVICRVIDSILQRKQRLIFEDRSPLFVDRNIRISTSNDPLRTGQISVVGTYGILRHIETSPIQHITTREEYHG